MLTEYFHNIKRNRMKEIEMHLRKCDPFTYNSVFRLAIDRLCFDFDMNEDCNFFGFWQLERFKGNIINAIERILWNY